jgi:CRISPR-associated protein Csm2
MKTVADLNRQLEQPGTLTEILKPKDFAEEDQVAATIALKHQDDLKPNQTRRVFHTFKEIDRATRGEENNTELKDEYRTRLTLLMPELAYATGRELIPREFYGILKRCLATEKLKTVGDLRRLVQFLSAILAYQKFHKHTKRRNP